MVQEKIDREVGDMWYKGSICLCDLLTAVLVI